MNYHLNSTIIDFNMVSHIAKISKYELPYLQIVPPSWMQDLNYSAYLKQIHHLSHFYKEGRVVMAHIVQANRMLFSDDNACSCPAEIVYDIKGETSTDELSKVARQLYQLKNTTPDDPELKKYAEHITSENTQLFNHVPKVLTDKELVTNTIFIWRPHLPNGILSLGYFPILISDTYQDVATVLPARFWQDSELYQDWLACNDMDMSSAFFVLNKKDDIWHNYQNYAKPTVQELELSNHQPDISHIDVSEKSITFLKQCILAVKEDYQENGMIKIRLFDKIKSIFKYGK